MRTTLGSPGSPWPFAAWDSVEGAFRYAREKSNSIRKKNGGSCKTLPFSVTTKIPRYWYFRQQLEKKRMLRSTENQKFGNCDLKLTKLLKYCLFIVFICLLISTVCTERPLNEQIQFFHNTCTQLVDEFSINLVNRSTTHSRVHHNVCKPAVSQLAWELQSGEAFENPPCFNPFNTCGRSNKAPV